jgi:uncharacterized LabA/DUF88 family protein
MSDTVVLQTNQIWAVKKNNGLITREIVKITMVHLSNADNYIKFKNNNGKFYSTSDKKMYAWIKRNRAIIIKAILTIPESIKPIPLPTKSIAIYKGQLNLLDSSNSKIYLAIDGRHLYNIVKHLKHPVDFKAMLLYFQKQGNLIRAMYYLNIFTHSDKDNWDNLVNWLGFNGYVTKANYNNDFTTQINICIDLLTLDKRINHIILIAGDASLAPLIAALKNRGIIVTIISQNPGFIADELRREADNYINLSDILGNLVQQRSLINSG